MIPRSYIVVALHLSWRKYWGHGSENYHNTRPSRTQNDIFYRLSVPWRRGRFPLRYVLQLCGPKKCKRGEFPIDWTMYRQMFARSCLLCPKDKNNKIYRDGRNTSLWIYNNFRIELRNSIELKRLIGKNRLNLPQILLIFKRVSEPFIKDWNFRLAPCYATVVQIIQ